MKLNRLESGVGNRADVDADVRAPRKPKNADADADAALREERPPRNPDAAADADASKFIKLL